MFIVCSCHFTPPLIHKYIDREPEGNELDKGGLESNFLANVTIVLQ